MIKDAGSGKGSEIINENLKKIFQQEVEKELPDRFTSLIEQLRAKDAARENNGSSDEHE